MKPDFDDHVSGQELEEQIDDAILFTMMTEEENNKQMHFTPHTSRRKSGTISSFGAFLYTIASLLLACLVVGALGMSFARLSCGGCIGNEWDTRRYLGVRSLDCICSSHCLHCSSLNLNRLFSRRSRGKRGLCGAIPNICEEFPPHSPHL